MLSAVINGLLLGGVAIEFPKGTIVGLIYVLAIGIPLGLYLSKSRLGFFNKGRRLVLQYYLMSFFFAFLIIVTWVAFNRGFIDRESSGLFTKE